MKDHQKILPQNFPNVRYMHMCVRIIVCVCIVRAQNKHLKLVGCLFNYKHYYRLSMGSPLEMYTYSKFVQIEDWLVIY